MKAHELAKKLLELPDAEIVIVKGEGEGYVSEFRFTPGGPWLAFGMIRIQIERKQNQVQTS